MKNNNREQIELVKAISKKMKEKGIKHDYETTQTSMYQDMRDSKETHIIMYYHNKNDEYKTQIRTHYYTPSHIKVLEHILKDFNWKKY